MFKKFLFFKANSTWTILLSFLLICSLGVYSPFQNSPDDSIVIYMIGNSTMANKPYKNGNPEKGWGQVFSLYFKEGVRIENYAVNGRSTKSFIDEGKWKAVLDKIQPGNYLIIEFGHNDEKIEDPKRYASPEDYKINLIKYVNECRSKGGIPILATPISRRMFDSLGVFVDNHGEYPDKCREVAKELDVPLLDLYAKTSELLKEYGEENSKRLYLFIDSTEYKSLPKGRVDNTHLSAYGAFRICDLAVEEIKINVPALAVWLKE